MLIFTLDLWLTVVRVNNLLSYVPSQNTTRHSGFAGGTYNIDAHKHPPAFWMDRQPS